MIHENCWLLHLPGGFSHLNLRVRLDPIPKHFQMEASGAILVAIQVEHFQSVLHVDPWCRTDRSRSVQFGAAYAAHAQKGVDKEPEDSGPVPFCLRSSFSDKATPIDENSMSLGKPLGPGQPSPSTPRSIRKKNLRTVVLADGKRAFFRRDRSSVLHPKHPPGPAERPVVSPNVFSLASPPWLSPIRGSFESERARKSA